MSWIYYHDLSPFLIRITDTIGLRWYSLAYILGVFVGYKFTLLFIKQGRLSISKNQAVDFITYSAFLTILGGRLGYCLFYNPQLFLNFDSSFPFWGFLKIHQGGMSSHGGILGLFISMCLFSRTYKMPVFPLVDPIALGGALALFMGRIANFINGELYGRVIENKAILAVKFPSEIFLWLSDTVKYRSELISLKAVIPRLKELVLLDSGTIPSGSTWVNWVLKAHEEPHYIHNLRYIGSLIVDKSGDSQIRSLLEPILFLRHPSQIYQALLGGLIPFLILLLIWSRTKKPGLISVAFIFIYTGARLITEFFRMPDIHIGYQWLDLTRGQWLTLGLLIIGVLYTLAFLKQKNSN